MVQVRGTRTVLHCPSVRLLDSQCQARVISLASAITQVPAGNVVQSPNEAEDSQDDKALRTSSNAQSLACDMHSHSSARLLYTLWDVVHPKELQGFEPAQLALYVR